MSSPTRGNNIPDIVLTPSHTTSITNVHVCAPISTYDHSSILFDLMQLTVCNDIYSLVNINWHRFMFVKNVIHDWLLVCLLLLLHLLTVLILMSTGWHLQIFVLVLFLRPPHYCMFINAFKSQCRLVA